MSLPIKVKFGMREYTVTIKV